MAGFERLNMLARMVFTELLGLPVELVSPRVKAEAPQGGVKVGLGVKLSVGVKVSVGVPVGVRVEVRVGLLVGVLVAACANERAGNPK